MSLWAVNTASDVALTATTAKTALGVKAAANSVVTMRAAHVNFESVTASDSPALIELVAGANDGTGTSETPVNYNRSHTASASYAAKSAYSAEPASLTVLKAWQYPVQGGVDIPLPIMVPVQSAAGGFLGIRVTSPQNQNCRVSIDVED